MFSLRVGPLIRHFPFNPYELSFMRGLLPSRASLMKGLQRTGGLNLLARLPVWRGLTIFNYHRIGDPTGSCLDWDLWSATPDDFEQHVRLIKQHAEVIGLDDLSSVLHQMTTGSSRRSRWAMITFDDGYRDNYEFAFPILKAQQTPGVFFLATGFLDRGGLAWWDEVAWMMRSQSDRAADADESQQARRIRDLLARCYACDPRQREELLQQLASETGAGRAPASVSERLWMTWPMIREMRAAGMSFGAHTVNHPVLSRLSYEEQSFEIGESRLRIEQELGEPITALSYPVGRADCINAETRRAMTTHGIDWGFSFTGGYETGRQLDRLCIARTAVERDMTPLEIRSMLTLPQVFA